MDRTAYLESRMRPVWRLGMMIRGVAAVAAMAAVLVRAAIGQPPAGGAVEPAAQAAHVPGPADIVELLAHRRSGVVSAWLRNGIRLHHYLFQPQATGAGEEEIERSRMGKGSGDAGDREGRAWLVISATVPGGDAVEDDATRDHSLAAVGAWTAPATRRINGAAMQAYLKEHDLSVIGSAMTDCIMLTVEAIGPSAGVDSTEALTPKRQEQARAAMRVTAELLSEPVVEEGAIERARAVAEKWSRAMMTDARMLAADRLDALLLPKGEARFRNPPGGVPAPCTVAQAQAMLDRTLASGPIEIAVVGTLGLDQALEIASSELGVVPSRGRISVDTIRAKRTVPRPVGPLESMEPVGAAGKGGGSGGGMQTVVSGFLSNDTVNLREQRALVLGSVLLRARLDKTLGELNKPRRQAAGEIGAWSQPGGSIAPGLGMVVATVSVRPEVADKVSEIIKKEIASIGAGDAATTEFEEARGKALARLREVVSTPQYWAGALSGATYRGYEPDGMVRAESDFSGFTPAEVRGIWKKYADDERNFFRLRFATPRVR